MSPFIDIHSHKRSTGEEVITVFNHLLHEGLEIPDLPFSTGLHPWFADQLSTSALTQALNLMADSQNLVAFGESGLDKVCKIPMRLQMDVFEIHLKFAQERNKPLIIHCVKAWEELLEISDKYQIVKILHGYNGAPELTERLVKKEFCFSIGHPIQNPSSKINSSLNLIPVNSLFCETDVAEIYIQTIYTAVARSKGIEVEDLRNGIFDNFQKIRNLENRKKWVK